MQAKYNALQTEESEQRTVKQVEEEKKQLNEERKRKEKEEEKVEKKQKEVKKEKKKKEKEAKAKAEMKQRDKEEKKSRLAIGPGCAERKGATWRWRRLLPSLHSSSTPHLCLLCLRHPLLNPPLHSSLHPSLISLNPSSSHLPSTLSFPISSTVAVDQEAERVSGSIPTSSRPHVRRAAQR